MQIPRGRTDLETNFVIDRNLIPLYVSGVYGK